MISFKLGYYYYTYIYSNEFANINNYVENSQYINNALRQQGFLANIDIESNDPADKVYIMYIQ